MSKKLLIILLSIPLSVFAQNVGKIAGKVVDKETGKVLVGANIQVEETSLGQASSSEGDFTIVDVPVGTHSVKCDFIGYRPLRVTNIIVSSGLTSDVTFNLTKSAIESGIIEVVAEKPIINKNATNTTRILTSETIENLPLRGVEAIVATQTGTVADDGNIYVRGSRAGDVAYYVDGVYMNNAYTLNNTSVVSNSAMEEVQFQSGGFSAEYGNVNGGVVNTTTRQGGTGLKLNAEGILGFGSSNSNTDGLHGYGYGLYNFSVGGPLSDNIKFFVNVETRSTDDLNPSSKPTYTMDYTEFDPEVYGLQVDASGVVVKDENENVTLLDFSGSQYMYVDSSGAGCDDTSVDGCFDNSEYNENYGMAPTGFEEGQGFFNYYRRVYGNVQDSTGAWIAQSDTIYSGYNNFQEVYGSKTNAGGTRTTVSANVLLDLSPLRIKLGGNLNQEDGRSYIHSYSLSNADNNPKFTETALSGYMNATYSISDQSYLKFGLSYYKFTDEFGDNKFFNDLDFASLNSYGSINNTSYNIMQGQNPSSLGNVAQYSAYGTTYDDYDYNESSYFGTKLDYLNQMGEHELKAGFEYRKNSIKYFRIAQPMEVTFKYWQAEMDSALDSQSDEWIYQTFHDAYTENLGYDVEGKDGTNGYQEPGEPTVMGAYIQDKVELDDLVINAGIRFDYFDPQVHAPADWSDIWLTGDRGVDRNGNDGENKWEKVDAYTHLNPRLGFSFPVSDKTKFHAQYGKFTQHPELNKLYLSDTRLSANLTQGNMTVSPNPSLKPEETTQYEVGFTQQFGGNSALNMTGFYKEVRNYTMMANVVDAKRNGVPFSWSQYMNGDFGTVKGLSFNFNMRRVNGLLANVSYTLSFAEGTGSDPASNFNIAWIGDTYPTVINPLDYDQRHTGSVMLDYRLGEDGGLLANTGLNLLYQFGSGTAYTPSEGYSVVYDRDWLTPTGTINSAYKPWTSTLDLKVDRKIDVGGFSVNVFAYVMNLLNTDNVDEVYPGSGEAGSDGWLSTPNGKDWLAQRTNGETYYLAKISDPRRWDAPRMIRFGFNIEL